MEIFGITVTFLLVYIQVTDVTAVECQAGIVYHSQEPLKAHWKLLGSDDPCSCTSVVPTGVTSTPSSESYFLCPTFRSLILTTTVSRIRSHFGCQRDVTASAKDDDKRTDHELIVEQPNKKSEMAFTTDASTFLEQTQTSVKENGTTSATTASGKNTTLFPLESTHDTTVIETTDTTEVTWERTTLDTTKLTTTETKPPSLLDATETSGNDMTSFPFESTHDTTVIETTETTEDTWERTTLDTTKLTTIETKPPSLLDETRSMYPTEVYDGFLYIAVLVRLTLAEAKKTCSELDSDSHLVSMVSEEEANAVQDFITSTGKVTQKFWIGLHSPRVLWDDGNYLAYHEIDLVESNANCFSMEDPAFEWESLECGEIRHYICEAKRNDIDSALCDFTWKDSCYTVSSASVTKDMASEACMANQGFALIQIETVEEQEEIKEKNYPNSVNGFWLGLKKTTGLPLYVWDDGFDTTVTFENFSPFHEEHFGICHYVDAGDNFVWMDDYCDSEYYFICKLPDDLSL